MVSLDGAAYQPDPPLSPKEFAQELALLRLAANGPESPEQWKDSQIARQKVNEQFLRAFGRKLFDRLFTGAVRKLYFETAGPLALVCQEPTLAELPWELLHDGNGWVARDRGILRLAQIEAPVASGETPPGPRLRVLVAMASPLLNKKLEPDDPSQPAIINLEQEAEVFRELQGKDFPADFVLRLHVTSEDLSRELGNNYHVLHFLGHGNVGVLALEDRYGVEAPVNTEWLRGEVLHTGLSLAVFQSCLTAANASQVPSVAYSLLEAGLPRVLAMQFSISVDGARAFFARFYSELARGTDLLEALRRSRHSLADAYSLGKAWPWEWATPVLFLRADVLGKPYPELTPAGEEGGKVTVKEEPQPFTPPDPSLQRDPLFTGRRKELVEVAENIDPEVPRKYPVTVIHGERGIGKTALAVEAIFRWGWWFDDVQWLRGRAEPVPEEIARFLHDYRAKELVADVGDFLRRWAERLKIPLRGDETPQALVQPIIAALAADGKKRLVVLDNMDLFIQDEAVKDILRGLPTNCRALITCPNVPKGLEVNEVDVVGMAFYDALSLMIDYAKHVKITLDFDAAEGILQLTSGHPMAMRMVIGWVSSGKRSWQEALEELREAEGPIFDYVFSRTLEMAGEDGRRLFRILALFDPLASREAWKAVSGMETAAFGDAVELLVRLSLVEDRRVDSQPYYTLQPLARAVAWQNLAADLDKEKYFERLAEFYKGWVKRKPAPALLELEASNLGTALEWLERHRREDVKPLLEALLSRLEHAWEEGKVQWARIQALLTGIPLSQLPSPPAWLPLQGRLVDVLVDFFHLHSYWPEWERLLQPALEVARALGDRQGEAQTLGNLGSVYAQQGRWEEAIANYEKALEIFRALGDRQGEAQTLGNLGSVYAQQGRWEEAIANYEKALEIFRALGDRQGEAQTLGNLGSVYRLQGRWEEAIANYEKALEIFHELGDRHGEGKTLNNLGLVYADQGRWEEAIACYEKDLEICRALGDRHGEAQTLTNLGSVYRLQGRWEEAIANYEKALEIFRALGDRHGEAQTLTNLGSVYRLQGRWEEAIANYEKALETFRALGDRHGEAQTLTNLGNVYQFQGRWEEAIANYEESLRIKRTLGDRHGEAQTLTNLGNVYQLQGRWEEAIACYEKDLEICRALGDRHGEAQTLTNLGNVYADQGRWEEAIANYEESLRIKRTLGDRHGEAQTLTNLGNVYADQGRWEEAIANYEKALEIFRALGDRHGEAQTLTNLGNVYQFQGRWEEAIANYEKALETFRALGDRHGEGATLNNLANVYAQQGELEKALEAAMQALRIFEELKAYPDLVTCHRQIASLSLQAGDLPTSFSHLARALLLSLQLHPKLVLDTIDSIVSIAKRLASEGRFPDVTVFGSGLWKVVMEVGVERLRNEELKASGVLAQLVSGVIALVGASKVEGKPEERAKAKEIALTMAKEIDEVTGGVWKLEEWVSGG
jgi:tetratricopeptide (TPR) repeat protein/CHAT domain-containing protein